MPKTKSDLKSQGIAARNAIPALERKKLSLAICERVIASEWIAADVILSYNAFNGEVDMEAFNQWAIDSGKKVAFPICKEGYMLVAAAPHGKDGLKVGKYGIISPVEGKCDLIKASDIGLVIVPCTAFHALTRARIGMGAGYYDRYLPQCLNAAKIGVAFEAQRVEELEADPWDVPLDRIATERQWH
ncbi:MAG: 5-formyltetrahydrofolate cyclo-ligase [Clostridiales bacterium]|jgi:5-formyltetrahydrofolate cyclo-ligase|nr:5-formyltetrahydrofolate cyclo-ligase [Clostridiales bacterium]